MINTKWLHSFCKLVEVGHFTRTAEMLHMTQSGLSQQVRKLEEQVGTDLLVREGKHFLLSDAGERIYKDGQEILLALSNMAQRVSEDPAYEGTVRVMSPGSIGLKLYPQLLALQKKHQKLSIDYRFAPNVDIEKAIARSEVDIGFMTSRPSLADVSCEPLNEEHLMLVSPVSVIEPSWDSLMQLGFIDHPDASYQADLLLGANYPEFQHSNMFVKKGFSNQIGLILEPVFLGLGFTVLPAHAVEAFPKQDGIKAHLLSNPVTETLYLCHNRQKPLQKRMETVISEAKRLL